MDTVSGKHKYKISINCPAAYWTVHLHEFVGETELNRLNVLVLIPILIFWFGFYCDSKCNRLAGNKENFVGKLLQSPMTQSDCQKSYLANCSMNQV